jgi:hypothetical protein
MKQLLAGVLLLLVIGIGAFFYRNTLEHPIALLGGQTACTAEAKVCPDGTSVGRTGPNCAFTACALPNFEDSVLGMAFVIPDGYTQNTAATGTDETLQAVFDKPSKGDVPHSIVIRRYAIPVGKTVNDVMLANTMHESSGLPVKAMSEFKTAIIHGQTFYSLVVERFEGQIHSVYYLPRAHDVLRFEVLEKDVDWTNPNLVIENLPEHAALLKMLGTLALQ